MKKNTTSWNRVAVWYDQLLQDKNTYQERVILPNMLRLLVPEKNQKILDLACGQGFFTAKFTARGATVIGVDIAPELIERAKNAVPDAVFYVAPSDRLSMITSGSIDAITCILALQNIRLIDETLAECRRVLKSQGRLLLVINHPAFRIPKQSSWGWDETIKTQYRRLDGYLSENTAAINMHPGKKKKEATVSFHRPLQYYFKLLAKNGLVVTRLEEWISDRHTASGPRAAAENRARKEFPLFLFLEATKPLGQL